MMKFLVLIIIVVLLAVGCSSASSTTPTPEFTPLPLRDITSSLQLQIFQLQEQINDLKQEVASLSSAMNWQNPNGLEWRVNDLQLRVSGLERQLERLLNPYH